MIKMILKPFIFLRCIPISVLFFTFVKTLIMKKLLYLFLGLLFISQHIVAQVPSSVPTDGLVGYYPFNGNSNDETGNGYNGNASNVNFVYDDRYDNPNSAVSFNSVNSIIIVDNFSHEFISGISISFWMYYQGFDDNPNKSIALLHRRTANNIDFDLSFSANDDIAMHLGAVTQLGPNVDNPNWTHYVITFDGQTMKYYVNNQLDGEFDASSNGQITNVDSTLEIGQYSDMTGSIGFEGGLDDLGFWDRALSEQEITNLYNSNSSDECLTMTINTGILSTNPVAYNSTVNIYPNPANDQITIDCGNLDNVEGWNIKITNILGQEVFSQPMNTQQYVIPLNTWTGQGMYFVKIINA